MDEKNLDLLKKSAAEMPSDLEDLGEEEVAQAVDGLKIGQGERGSSPSIVHDPKMEAEIKEMFRDIVSQYITPVGKSIRALANGDLSERNIDILIGALKPLILACEEIHYNDIYDVLKSIEQPLTAFREGKKRVLSKKDIRNITTDYKELMRLISRSVGTELLDNTTTGSIMRATTAAPTLGATGASSPAELHVSDALAFFRDADPRDIQRLYAAGLIKLGLLSQATAQEISESTGIGLEQAEKLRDSATNAINGLQIAATVTGPPKADTAASSSRPPAYDLDEDDQSAVFSNSKNRWITAVDAMMAEMNHCFQSTTALTTELERTHRALVRMRVAREQFKGEAEFYNDDLMEMLETSERLNEEMGTPVNAHRQLLKNLQRIIDVVNSALKKTEVIYSQLDETMEDLQDVEAQLIALRRRKGGAAKTGLRRRSAPSSTESIEEAEGGGDEPLPRRLN